MRVLISKESKLKLLEILKQRNKTETLKGLSIKLNLPFKTLQNWIYSNRYLPENLLPAKHSLEILERQKENWGQEKGGKIGGVKCHIKLKKKLGERGYSNIMKMRGKQIKNTLFKKYGIQELTKMAVEGKLKKRENISKRLEKENENQFINKEVFLDLTKINYSSNDLKKRIRFPKKITPELAEEIGAHLGDGCLSKNRNYFSIKTNKKEEDYMRYLFKLYKKLYNLDLKMMRLSSVVGFEVYSKALCDFKNKVLGLPYGEKIHKIEIPKAVTDTKNKEVYYALIRGLFDTDGCISIIKKNNKGYPVISLSIKSEKLIKQVAEMLRKLGYIPFSKGYRVSLNGIVMFKKWVKEIGSNNSKNINKLKWANSSTDRIFPCGF